MPALDFGLAAASSVSFAPHNINNQSNNDSRGCQLEGRAEARRRKLNQAGEMGRNGWAVTEPRDARTRGRGSPQG